MELNIAEWESVNTQRLVELGRTSFQWPDGMLIRDAKCDCALASLCLHLVPGLGRTTSSADGAPGRADGHCHVVGANRRAFGSRVHTRHSLYRGECPSHQIFSIENPICVPMSQTTAPTLLAILEHALESIRFTHASHCSLCAT